MHLSGFNRSRNALWLALAASLFVCVPEAAADRLIAPARSPRDAIAEWPAFERYLRGSGQQPLPSWLAWKSEAAHCDTGRPVPVRTGLHAGAHDVGCVAARRQVPAGALVVTSCDDDGSPGTLRATVASAVSGDTIDMTQLSCSYITTASGSITITVDDLTLVGPGPAVFALYAGPTDRVLTHTGTGTLTLESLAVVHGNAYANTAPDDARGGCIYSSGSVHVSSGGLVDCYAVNARSDGGIAEGGAIFAQSTITLENSYLVSNVAFGYEAKGGAMRADSVVVTDSYVGGYPFGNTVYSTGFTGIFTRFPAGGGGGVYANAATISNSLFVGNSTQKFTQRGGALMLMYGQSSITGSLFFTNQAGGYGGAVFMPRRWPVAGYYQYCGSSKLTVTNSTFSRNVATLGAGLYAGCELDLANRHDRVQLGDRFRQRARGRLDDQ